MGILKALYIAANIAALGVVTASICFDFSTMTFKDVTVRDAGIVPFLLVLYLAAYAILQGKTAPQE